MNGILLVDKPADWTSMDVCAKLRGALHEKKVGHAGTLDPMATGLLTVFLGRASRAAEFAEAQDKTYEAALRLGLVTDTQDSSGRVLESHPADCSPEELEAVLPRFRGEISQIPPMYSAIKIKGQKLYQLARKGREVERPARRVTIHELRCLGRREGDFLLRIRCSKGTYIRSLCHDIGQALGCGGVMSALRRTEAGDFSVEQARSLPDILAAAEQGRAQELLLGVDTLFADRPALKLSEGQAGAVRCGRWFSFPGAAGEYRLYAPDGEFLALGRVGDGKLTTVKSFFKIN